jgi:hypothetical protein
LSGPKEKEEATLVPQPCDQKTSLYLLQYEGLKKYEYTSDECSRYICSVSDFKAKVTRLNELTVCQ